MGVGRTLNGGVVQSAAIGEFGMSYLFSAGNVGGRVFKRGSEESLLALSGTPDIASGLNWGRSLESGIVLNANHKGEIFEKLASLTLSRIESGQNVADNRKVEFYGLALHGLEAVAGLSVGPELYYSRFRQNLSSFELGHGGYFSPRDSVTFGGYARYETSLGSMALTFTGGLGLGYSRVDATASNPITGSIPGFYPASTARGIAYHGRMQGLQPLSPNWDLGFGLGFQRSPSFSDWRANVFVKRNWSK